MRRGRKTRATREKIQSAGLGLAIQTIRRQRNLPIEEVAEAIGLCKSGLALIESQTQFPSMAVLYAIADFYEVQVSSIFRLAEIINGRDGKETNLQMHQLATQIYNKEFSLNKRIKRA